MTRCSFEDKREFDIFLNSNSFSKVFLKNQWQLRRRFSHSTRRKYRFADSWHIFTPLDASSSCDTDKRQTFQQHNCHKSGEIEIAMSLLYSWKDKTRFSHTLQVRSTLVLVPQCLYSLSSALVRCEARLCDHVTSQLSLHPRVSPTSPHRIITIAAVISANSINTKPHRDVLTQNNNLRAKRTAWASVANRTISRFLRPAIARLARNRACNSSTATILHNRTLDVPEWFDSAGFRFDSARFLLSIQQEILVRFSKKFSYIYREYTSIGHKTEHHK